MALTAKDARALADLLYEVADEIEGYLDKNKSAISPDDCKKLRKSARALLRKSAAATTQAVGLSVAQMADDANQLRQVVEEAKDSLVQLQDIKKMIDVVSALVNLATAIVGKKPGAVVKSVQKLQKLR
ncbi:MAG: hypothetical protein OXI87_17510 [Albidovulum sp.]|nr:hypothetical protein [Albidovulum sp.]